MSEFLAYTVFGIVTASIYAVAASGLVVTYVTSGVFNIAHGAIGMLMAFTYWELSVNQGWPAYVGLPLVVFVAAPLVGAVIERGLMRNLRGAAVATSLTITVGLLVALVGLAQGIWDPSVARQMPPFFGERGFRLGDVFVSLHNVVTFGVAIAVALSLRILLFQTRTGIAMRAVVDDRDLALMTGARARRASQLSWALGSSLAAMAGILLAPVLQLDVLILTLLIVNAFAAAMVGRLSNLPLTFVGAIALGLIESYAVGYVNLSGPLSGLRPALPTLFLFIILLVMPEARLRSGRLSSATNPRPPTRRTSLIAAVGLVAVVAALANVLGPGEISRLAGGLAFGVLMLSLVLLVGQGGQVSLCQMTFAGLGAFAMAKWGGSGNPLGLIAAIGLAGFAGALVSLPALRLQGLYLALATMAFAVLMDNLVFPNNQVFGTFGSLPVGRLDLFGFSFDNERFYFVLLAVAFALVGLFIISIRRGSFGRTLAAMRDSPVACATLGLSLTRTKLAVFSMSAAIAGLAGALLGGLRTVAGSTDFVMFQSLPILLVAVIGGITTVSGALVGGLLFSALPIIQDRFPALAGLTPLLVGLGAVSLGRNPNGMAFMVAERLPRLRGPREPAEPGARPRGPGQDEPVEEEVAGVGAPAG